MGEAANYIVLAIPVFFILIVLEVLVDRLKHSGHYRFNDAVTNINCGVVEQVSGAFTAVLLFAAYLAIYENLRFFDIGNSVLAWIVLFIAVDFFYYWFHRYAHEINLLWGGHVVHHQSEEYNLSVALRQGAFQKFSSWVFYLPLAFVGFDPIMFLIVNQFQTLYQFWIHTRHIDRLPAPFEYIFNTPSHHRVHHGRNPIYIDRNHAGTLIIWDRMFGTFQAEEETVVFGITKPLNSWNPVWAQLVFWRDLFEELPKAKGLWHKLELLFREPGWRPPEMGGPVAIPKVTPDTEIKFETSIPAGLNFYILFQYAVVLTGASVFLFLFENYSLPLQLGLTALIFFSVINLGALFESKAWVFIAELLRLILLPAVIIVLAYSHTSPLLLIGIGLVFFITSAIWLRYNYHELHTQLGTQSAVS